MTPTHPATKLPALMQEIRDQLKEGAVVDGAPLPTEPREAVGWMVHRLYLRTSRYREQQWRADTAGLDPDVAEFVQVFRRRAENVGIPTYADIAFRTRAHQARLYVLGQSDELPEQSVYCTGRAFSLRHALKHDMPAVCWQVLAHIGKEAAASLGLDVAWDETCPWQWVVA